MEHILQAVLGLVTDQELSQITMRIISDVVVTSLIAIPLSWGVISMLVLLITALTSTRGGYRE